MKYLTADDVALINASFVGPDALADFALLESAVLRPQTTLGGLDAYTSLHEKAAALMHSLVRNHPFVDGNKRAAVASVYVFLRLNGWRLVLEQEEAIALAVDAAEGLLDVPAIAKKLTGGSVEVELPPLQS